VGFGSKERRGTGFLVFYLREKMGQEPKMKDGGGDGEGRKRFQTNPWILKTPFSTANGSRDWLGSSKVIDMCRSKVLTLWVPERSELDMFTKLRTFSPITTAHRYYARKLTRHA